MAAAASAAGVIAVASGAAAVYVCDCFEPLAWGRDRKNLQPIPQDAPLVRLFSKALGRRTRNLRVSLSEDILLVGRRPGPAEAQFFLSGAKVSTEGDVLTVVPRNADVIIFYLESCDEADQWAAELDSASMLVEQGAAPSSAQTAITEYQDRVKTARIAELEARVNATLTAAVQRSRRIQELELVVEQGEKREERIRELELRVEEVTTEANSRADRIKELEDIISSGNIGAIKDEVATGILKDAVSFAEEMLANREEEMMIDGSSASKLKESVDRVQGGDKVVDREVAELISNLVTALRWPLVLRKRLANAENTVKEQQAVHDETMQQLHDLQKSAACAQPDLAALRERESTAQTAQKQAEAEAQKLKGLLTEAERDAEKAVQQQREALTVDHQAELRALQELCAGAQEQSRAAQAQAEELRGRLHAAETAIAASDARVASAESLSHESMAQASELRESLAAAEQNELEACKLRARLEKAEQAYEQASTRQQELLSGAEPGTNGAGHQPGGTAGLAAELEREQARTAELERRLSAAVLASRMPSGTASAGQAKDSGSRSVSHGPGRVAKAAKELDARMSRAERALGAAAPPGTPAARSPA